MANAAELAEKIAAVKESVEEMAGRFASSKGQAEQMVDLLSAIGIDGSAQRFQNVVEKCEESESGRVVLAGGLEKAHWQVMSAVHGTMGPGAYGTGPGGRIVPKTQSGGADGGPQPGGLDAIPPHLRQDPTPTGEELTGVDSTIGPFQKEHENANADRKMNTMSRLGRSLVRNVEELQTFGRDLTTSAKNTSKGFDPADPGTYPTSTEVPSYTPQIHSPSAAQPDPTDVVGAAIVMAAVVTEGIGRLIERRSRRHHGE